MSNLTSLFLELDGREGGGRRVFILGLQIGLFHVGDGKTESFHVEESHFPQVFDTYTLMELGKPRNFIFQSLWHVYLNEIGKLNLPQPTWNISLISFESLIFIFLQFNS